MASEIKVNTIKDLGGNTIVSSNGSGTISGLPASAISSGTVATARLGSGTASSSTFLAGNNTFAPLTTNATHSGEVTGSGALTIADNIVDEANLKVSNTPTNGYVLSAQSGNTGGLTWAEAGGGTLVKTGQTTLGSTTGAITVDNCFTSDYKNYFVIIQTIVNTVDSQQLKMRLRTGGGSGSTDTGSQYRYGSRYFQDNGGVDSNTGIDQQQFTIATNNEGDPSWKGYCGTLTFYQPQVNTSTRYDGHASFIQANQANVTASYLAGHYDSDAVHTGFTLYFAGGDIRANANIIVYGISEA